MLQFIDKLRHFTSFLSHQTLLFQKYWHLSGSNESWASCYKREHNSVCYSSPKVNLSGQTNYKILHALFSIQSWIDVWGKFPWSRFSCEKQKPLVTPSCSSFKESRVRFWLHSTSKVPQTFSISLHLSKDDNVNSNHRCLPAFWVESDVAAKRGLI